ncbi:MAG: FeoA family protein [Candidatus Micrarchaeota archaeon]|nr:FeoA family protein [Candidatus Micrarchaeota archaeon]
MLLSDAKQGTTVTIRKVVAGHALQNRLSELGIYKGGKARVIKNDSGPIVLEVLGGRLAIGRGQAEKIEVAA